MTSPPSTHPDPTPNLDKIYPFAITLAKRAGQMLTDALTARRTSTNSQTTQKESSVDIVTPTDLAIEQFLQTSIAREYPSHAFVGEESYSSQSFGNPASKPYLVTNAPTWVVDPLDGTVNFTHAMPLFCVSIAFCLDGWPVVGVVYAPLLGQLFSACRGRGAWLNETTRLPYLGAGVGPIPRDAPAGCVFGCEWGKQRGWSEHENGALKRKVGSFVGMAASRDSEVKGGKGGGMVHGVRSLGSATLDLCYVAMGGVDLWWEGGCWEWDVAAGVCLVEEAGGLVTGANPPAENEEDWRVERCRLGGRLYLAVRPAVDDIVSGESAREGQERAVREVWRRVERLEYARPEI